MKDTEVTTETIRDEHRASVDPARHWVYLVAVLVGSVALMLVLMLILERVAYGR